MRASRSALILLHFLVWSPATAFAIDRGQWGHDPDTAAWFKSLRNGNGLSCCDYVDGVRIDDPDWRELTDGGVEVFAKGAWHVIPPEKVIQGTNRVGYPILWWPENWPAPTCFLPGSGG